jgi:hypothetical protein
MITWKIKERLERRIFDQVMICDTGTTNEKGLHWDDHEHEAAFARGLFANMSFWV